MRHEAGGRRQEGSGSGEVRGRGKLEFRIQSWESAVG
jgi:hypothetical protein